MTLEGPSTLFLDTSKGDEVPSLSVPCSRPLVYDRDSPNFCPVFLLSLVVHVLVRSHFPVPHKTLVQDQETTSASVRNSDLSTRPEQTLPVTLLDVLDGKSDTGTLHYDTPYLPILLGLILCRRHYLIFVT